MSPAPPDWDEVLGETRDQTNSVLDQVRTRWAAAAAAAALLVTVAAGIVLVRSTDPSLQAHARGLSANRAGTGERRRANGDHDSGDRPACRPSASDDAVTVDVTANSGDVQIDELGHTLVASSALDSYAPVAQLLQERRATAEVHADPRLARRLRTAIAADGDLVVAPQA